jgi:hypothetical protein
MATQAVTIYLPDGEKLRWSVGCDAVESIHRLNYNTILVRFEDGYEIEYCNMPSILFNDQKLAK